MPRENENKNKIVVSKDDIEQEKEKRLKKITPVPLRVESVQKKYTTDNQIRVSQEDVTLQSLKATQIIKPHDHSVITTSSIIVKGVAHPNVTVIMEISNQRRKKWRARTNQEGEFQFKNVALEKPAKTPQNPEQSLTITVYHESYAQNKTPRLLSKVIIYMGQPHFIGKSDPHTRHKFIETDKNQMVRCTPGGHYLLQSTWHEAGQKCPICNANAYITSQNEIFDISLTEWNKQVKKQ